MNKQYDCIVIGAGHAGIEAALSSSRMGCSTLLITMNLDTVGHMSCNPAIGGLAKSQLVKEVDALGGEMGKAADACAVQYRLLNRSKGPAVWATRLQIDRHMYKAYMKKAVENQIGLDLFQDLVEKILVENNSIVGVLTKTGQAIKAKTLIITPGTFLNGLIHIGLNNFSGGRLGDGPSVGLTASFKELGFQMGRFKTGTCARIDGRTINFSQIIKQEPDFDCHPMSFLNDKISARQLPCFITYTNQNTHQIIRDNLDRSPLYTGIIKSTGVRYCPSIEDKIVKFSDKEKHHVFLEPEGFDTHEYYPNGLSTSLPFDAQYQMLHSIEGLENCVITRPGYGIEHEIVYPTQLYPTLETKLIKNLFLAGQINGTTGYEEAASQGLIAGINAALSIKGKESFVLDRSEAYIGVLIDDLVTKGTNEPYRMFTSRAEYRLLLREDNADLRLTELGRQAGLVDDYRYERFISRKVRIESEFERLSNNRINGVTLEQMLKRPEVAYEHVMADDSVCVTMQDRLHIETQVKYEGFITRQLSEVERFKKIERINIPKNLDYSAMPSLSKEIKEKLIAAKPLTLGQASRISGITPASISMLMVWIEKMRNERN